MAPWQENFWQSLPEELFRALPSEQVAELRSLRQESDPQIFAHTLLNFASRREKQGDSATALRFYQILAASNDFDGPLQHQAQARAAALQGQGSIGNQAEVLLSRFFDEAMAPGPILAMGLAGSSFKISRALGLNLLRQAPLDMTIARTAANGFGLMTESAIFTMASKSAAAIAGQSQDWSESALKREWLAGTLLLGSLKIGGALAQRGGRDLLQAAYKTEYRSLQKGLELTSRAIQPLGLYSGIMLAHHVQSGLGLRPHQDVATAMVDGAATLLHLYVGGALANRLGAGKLDRVATELEMRIGNIPSRGSFFDKMTGSAPAIAIAGRSDGKVAPQPLPTNEPLQMAVVDPFGLRMIMDQRVVDGYTARLPKATHRHLLSLFAPENYPGPNRNIDKYHFLLMLAQNPIGQAFGALDAAIPTLAEAVKFSDPQTNASSYSHWLTKQVYADSLKRNDGEALGRLLSFLGSGGKVTDLEAEVARSYPEAGLPKGPPPMPDFWRGRQGLYGQIRNLPLSAESKTALSKWVNGLVFNRGNAFTSDLNLLGNLNYNLGLPSRATLIDRAIALAGQSPMGMARLARLQVVLENKLDPLTEFKLAELADPEVKIFGAETPWTSSPSSTPSQANAYLGARAPLRTIAEMESRAAELLDPRQVEARRIRRDGILEGLFPDRIEPRHFRPEFLAEAFRRLGDPTSLAVADAILRRDFALEILPAKAFQHRVNEFFNIEGNESAYYYRPANPQQKGLMLIREPEIKVYSAAPARDAYFGLMGSIVHEFRHFTEITPGQKRTKEVHLYQEMSAHFSEFLWRAEHGDNQPYSIWVGNTALGPALRFHDFYENAYGSWWKSTSPNPQILHAGRQGP